MAVGNASAAGWRAKVLEFCASSSAQFQFDATCGPVHARALAGVLTVAVAARCPLRLIPRSVWVRNGRLLDQRPYLWLNIDTHFRLVEHREQDVLSSNRRNDTERGSHASFLGYSWRPKEART
jgi:hypothetical protein